MNQLYFELGTEKFARRWCANLMKIDPAKFREGSNASEYLLDIWMDFPWNPDDRMAVIQYITGDQDLRHIVHAFDVRCCWPRIVDWDPITHERFLAIYSLERDLLVTALAGYRYADAKDDGKLLQDFLEAWDPREDMRYGN